MSPIYTHIHFQYHQYITNKFKLSHQISPIYTNLTNPSNLTNLRKISNINHNHVTISHLSLVIVSVTSVVAPAARLPGALLTRRKLSHEQLHLSQSSLQTGDPLSIGLRLLPQGLRLRPQGTRLLSNGLNLLLKLGSVDVPPSGPGASKNIHVQPDLVIRPNVSKVTRVLVVLSSLPSVTATS